MKPKTEAAVPATAPSGSIDSEFMLEAAQPNMNMITARSRRTARAAEAREAEADEEHAAQSGEDEDRDVRQPPHAEAPDDPRVEEGRHRHQPGHGGEGDGELDAQAVDVDVDLLGGADEAEQRAEQERAGQAVAEGHAVGDDDAEALRRSTRP